MSARMLSRPEVEELTGLSRTTIYDKMKDGTFPRPLRLSKGRVGWPRAVVEQWIADCEVGGPEVAA